MLCSVEICNVGEGDRRRKRRKENEDNGRKEWQENKKGKTKINRNGRMVLKGKEEETMNLGVSGTSKNYLLKWNCKSKNILFLDEPD